MFRALGLPKDLVPVALTAFDKHSQNDMLYDPKKVKNITKEDCQKADEIFAWAGLPFDTQTPMEEFKLLYYF